MDFPNQNPQPFQPPVPPTPTPQPMPTPPTMVGAPAGVNTPPAPMPAAATGTGPMMATPMSGPVQIPVQNQPVATPGEDQVYTMPEKFLSPNQPPVAQKKKSHKTLTLVLIGIIVLAILAIVGGLLFYFFSVLPATQTTNTINQPAENTNEILNNNNAVSNTNNAAIDNTNAANVNNTNVTANTNTITGIGNENTNDNVNAANTNVNTNTVTNVNTAATTPAQAPDSDADALTSEEEKMWGTKAELPDTDSDGYTDGVELLAGYDPTNEVSAGRLSDSGKVGTYANKTNGYSIYYPINWVPEALSEGSDKEILFTPNTLETAGEFVEVIVEQNPAGLTAAAWYSEQAGVSAEQLEVVKTFSDLAGVLSVDGYTAYFTTNNNVYAVSYHYGNSPTVNFSSTFRLMVNSFSLTKKAQQANDAVNDNSNDNVNNTNSTNTTN